MMMFARLMDMAPLNSNVNYIDLVMLDMEAHHK